MAEWWKHYAEYLLWQKWKDTQHGQIASPTYSFSVRLRFGCIRVHTIPPRVGQTGQRTWGNRYPILSCSFVIP